MAQATPPSTAASQAPLASLFASSTAMAGRPRNTAAAPMVSAGEMGTCSPPLWWITSQPITASTNQAPKAPARPRYQEVGGPVGGRCGPSWSVQATTSLLDQYSPIAVTSL